MRPSKIGSWGLIGMKVVCLLLVLGAYAVSAVGQTASASLGKEASSSTLTNGTANLEDRVNSAAAARTPFDFPNAPSAKLPQLAGRFYFSSPAG
jgi:hypothetical protein